MFSLTFFLVTSFISFDNILVHLSLWRPICIALISRQTSWFCITYILHYIFTHFTQYFYATDANNQQILATWPIRRTISTYMYNTSSVCLFEVITVMNAFCCQGAHWLRMFNDASTDWSDRFILRYDVYSNWLQTCGLGQSHQLTDTS